MKLKLLFLLFFYFLISTAFAQVGIGNSTPEAMLDITSTTNGVLLPRVALTSLTNSSPVINPNGGSLVDGTMVWNTASAVAPVGFYYWQNSKWNQLLANNEQQVFMGKMIITASGSMSTNLPFRAKSIEFTVVNNVKDANGFFENSTNNLNTKSNSFGYGFGYATEYTPGMILQQAVAGAGSGNSINDIGTYSSDNSCIAAQFVNQNGTSLGRTRASLSTFTSNVATANGFTINVTEFTDPIVVLFKAYKY